MYLFFQGLSHYQIASLERSYGVDIWHRLHLLTHQHRGIINAET